MPRVPRPRLVPRASRRAPLTPRVSRCAPPHLAPLPPGLALRTAEVRPPRRWHRTPCRHQAPRQRASIGGQQVDEHMLQLYVLCVLDDVCCIYLIWMLQK